MRSSGAFSRTLVTLVPLLIVACVSGTAMTTGHQKRTPVHVSRVKLYRDPPADYEELGLVEARSQVGSTAEAVEGQVLVELKKQAARLGANGILLSTPERTTIARGKAIWVTRE